MKKVDIILSHIKGQPHFSSLNRHSCYGKYIDMLPPRFKGAIAFVYVRDEIMHIALSHPGYKMELNLNKNLLLSLLDTLVTGDTDCQILKAKKIILFNSKYAATQELGGDPETIPYYNELSNGDFEDTSSDPKLQAQFERLRKTIQNNRRDD